MSGVIFKKTDNRESGNVLFLILIACALFAALSYVIINSTRTSGGSISKEKAKLEASALTQFGTSMEVAVGRLLISGCSEDQISFETPRSQAWGAGHNYYNANAPTNNKCHVFAKEGAGAVVPSVNTEILSVFPNDFFNEGYGYAFVANLTVPGVGTFELGEDDNTEPNSVAVLLPYVKPEICAAINEGLDINYDLSKTQPPGSQAVAPVLSAGIAFDGTYAINYQNTIRTDWHPEFTGQRTGCYYVHQEDAYVYYHIVLAR